MLDQIRLDGSPGEFAGAIWKLNKELSERGTKSPFVISKPALPSSNKWGGQTQNVSAFYANDSEAEVTIRLPGGKQAEAHRVIARRVNEDQMDFIVVADDAIVPWIADELNQLLSLASNLRVLEGCGKYEFQMTLPDVPLKPVESASKNQTITPIEYTGLNSTAGTRELTRRISARDHSERYFVYADFWTAARSVGQFISEGHSQIADSGVVFELRHNEAYPHLWIWVRADTPNRRIGQISVTEQGKHKSWIDCNSRHQFGIGYDAMALFLEVFERWIREHGLTYPPKPDKGQRKVSGTPKPGGRPRNLNARQVKRGMNIETKPKLEELLKERAKNIKSGMVTISWTSACANAGIRPETAHKYARLLHQRWSDASYTPDITEFT